MISREEDTFKVQFNGAHEVVLNQQELGRGQMPNWRFELSRNKNVCNEYKKTEYMECNFSKSWNTNEVVVNIENQDVQ